MPAAIPVIAGAVATYAGVVTTVVGAAAVGAVAGAVVAAARGENILRGALMGGLGGAAGFGLMGAMGMAGAEAGVGMAEAGTAAADVAPAAIESAASTAPQIASEGVVNGWSLAETTPIADIGTVSQSAVSTGAAQGGGLLQQSGMTGLNTSTANSGLNMSVDPAMAGRTDLLSTLTKTPTPPANSGLLDTFQTWAQKNPTLAMGAVQTVGNGLAGMGTASSEAERLAYQRERDELNRRNASYGRLPSTTWKSAAK